VKVVVSLLAEQELVEGAKFYANRAGPQLGHSFLAEFERSVALLQEHPLLGAAWRYATRRLPLRRFPFSIVYQLHDAELRVVAVAHQRRRPGYWRKFS